MKKRERRVVACQRKKEQNQKEYLPEHIIFEILTRLPAEFLHNNVRNVCQEWADLIDSRMFIEHHRSRLRTGLLIQRRFSTDLHFLDVNKGKAVLKRETRGFPGIAMSCCRGIILFRSPELNFSFWVANIVTKQFLELPFGPSHLEDPMLVAIGCDRLCGEFKVICFCSDGVDAYYWSFLTVGKDEAWRKVDLVSSQISIESFKDRFWMSSGGVIYGVLGRSNIIAVDVGDESTWTVKVRVDKDERSGGFVEEENNLAHISHGRKETTLSIHRLDDFRRSAWVKIYKFQLHPSAYSVVYKSSSIAWAENGKLLLFQRFSTFEVWGFYVRTGRCKVLKRLPMCIQVFDMSRSLTRFAF